MPAETSIPARAWTMPEHNNCLRPIEPTQSEPTTPVYGAPATAPATRVYKGLELLARKSVGDTLWLQASYVYSSLRGNYDGEVDEGRFATSPGLTADYDYPQFEHNAYGRLYLDRPVNFRAAGFYRTPLKLSVGIEAYVLSGAPLDKTGYFNSIYLSAVQLVPRGSAGRLPTLWEASATLEYPMRLGPATVTLQGFVYNLFNNQIRTSQDMEWTYSAPPPPLPYPNYDPNQPNRNENYGKATTRQAPRFFRAAARISF